MQKGKHTETDKLPIVRFLCLQRDHREFQLLPTTTITKNNQNCSIKKIIMMHKHTLKTRYIIEWYERLPLKLVKKLHIDIDL